MLYIPDAVSLLFPAADLDMSGNSVAASPERDGGREKEKDTVAVAMTLGS